MQVAKVVNAPSVWRDLHAILSQGLWNQVPVGAEYYRGHDNARVITQSLLEGGRRQVRGRRIAFPGQRPGALDVGSVAYGASLGVEGFSIGSIGEG